MYEHEINEEAIYEHKLHEATKEEHLNTKS